VALEACGRLIGLASLLSVWSHWFKIDAPATQLGLQAIGDVGRANVRADIGDIFLGIGLFAIIAAWQKNRLWLSAAILLVSGALLGRFISIAINGYSPRVGVPMLVDGLVIANLIFAYWAWGEKPEGL
jgi:hypothetical protein